MTVTEQGCAELAERLRAHMPMLDSAALPTKSEVFVLSGYSAREHHDTLKAAATILDRLTVDGLAGALWFSELVPGSGYELSSWPKDVPPGTQAVFRKLAKTAISYITAPSGELSDGIPGSTSTAASSSAMASDSGQVKL